MNRTWAGTSGLTRRHHVLVGKGYERGIRASWASVRLGGLAAVAGGLMWVVKGGSILLTGQQPPVVFEAALPLFATDLGKPDQRAVPIAHGGHELVNPDPAPVLPHPPRLALGLLGRTWVPVSLVLPSAALHHIWGRDTALLPNG